MSEVFASIGNLARQAADLARAAIVLGCAAALILAGPFLPL